MLNSRNGSHHARRIWPVVAGLLIGFRDRAVIATNGSRSYTAFDCRTHYITGVRDRSWLTCQCRYRANGQSALKLPKVVGHQDKGRRGARS